MSQRTNKNDNNRVDIKVYDITNPNGNGKIRHTITMTNGVETNHQPENVGNNESVSVIVGKDQTVNDITFESVSTDWRKFLYSYEY